jgi:hypothetical protein
MSHASSAHAQDLTQRAPFLRAATRQLLEPQLEPLRAAALGVTLQSLAQAPEGLERCARAHARPHARACVHVHALPPSCPQDLLQLLQPPQHAASVAASLKSAGSLGAGRNLDSAALSRLCDALAATVDGEPVEKQRVLECVALGERADVLISLLKRQLEASPPPC